MKRCGSTMANVNKKVLPSIVRLNVGGKHFDTTRETLQPAAFFTPWLEARFEMACDEDGRVFIDRDGHLFEIILSFLRNYQRPAQTTIDSHKNALLVECEFFQIDSLAYHLRGDVSPYDMRPEDRFIQSEEAQLLEFFAVDHSPLDRNLLQPHMLRAKAPRPVAVDTFDEFFDSLNRFSDNLLDELSKIPDIVIAGGSVIGSLVKTTRSDLDIFLTCEKAVAKERVKAVYDAVQCNMRRNHGEASSLLVTRTLNAITFYQCQGKSLTYGVPAQVILKVGNSITEILHNFDVDCSCFAYLPSTRKLFCTHRGLRAVRYGANLVDSAYGGKSYTTRLEKYASRGFAIATPGYSPDLVRADLLGDRYAYFTHSGLLLRMGRCIWDRVSATCVPNIMESLKIMPETMRTGVAVRNLAKLIVLDGGNVVRHDNDIMRANARVCVPYRTDASTSRGEYVVVEGRALEDKITVGDKENDLYVSMIGELVEMILGKIRGAAVEDAWRTGGSVRAKNTCQGIFCVYDLVKCNSSFDDLRFVLDARYDAGGVSTETFERRNHFPALIIFSEIGPRHQIEDFTAGVYR